jgi:hypothetical protein
MRVWDLPPSLLCRQHLLGEHREIHAVWNVITHDRRGYRHHPETKRWVGHLRALYLRHRRIVAEMARRGYRHRTPLDARRATGRARVGAYVDPPARQRALLRAKGCACRVGRRAAGARPRSPRA